jgi:Icc protein
VLACPQIVRVPGNHAARNVGYLHFEDSFGARDSRLRLQLDRLEIALVAVDSSKPDLDEGEIGREHYGWIEEGFGGEADLRVFVCHHHLVPVPGTGRERNQVLDAGDVLSLLRRCEVDLVLSGHRHVPYVWPIAGMLLVHSGTVSTLRTRGFPTPPTASSASRRGGSPSTSASPTASRGAWVTTRATGRPNSLPPRRPVRPRPTRSLAGGG